MCHICLQTPCHPRCPNANEPDLFALCVNCDRKIFEGDDYYELDGEPWCEDCIEKSRKTAEGV